MQSLTVARLFFPLNVPRYAVEDLQLRSQIFLPLFVLFVVPRAQEEQKTIIIVLISSRVSKIVFQ